MTRSLHALAIGVALVSGNTQLAAADSSFGQNMNRLIEDALDAVGLVPGFDICVVGGDRVIYLEGFGYRDVENQLPVTADTGFYIASSSKSFTGMAARVMAARGDLDLDASASRYLPELRLPEPLSTDDVSVRALLTHRNGINNREVQRQLAFVRSLSEEEFLELMLTQSRPMPTDFIYSNLGYNVFGYLLETVTGKSWKQVVSETILIPAGMTNTTTSIEAASAGRFAWPYAAAGDSYERVPIKSEGTIHAAGGIVTTPADLARWLIVNLNDGEIDGRAALNAEAVRAAHQTYATTDREFYRFRRTGYGLGWYHSEFEGEQLVHHFGGFAGYHAHVSFTPEHRIGVATLM